MAEWTRSDPDYSLLPNLYVESVYKDGVLKWYEIFPCSDYVLHIPSGDVPAGDEEGNIIYDEDGNPVIDIPYYSWGGAMAPSDYDFETNPNGFEAVPYDESMRVFSSKPPLETI